MARTCSATISRLQVFLLSKHVDFCVVELSFRAQVQASVHAEDGRGNEKFLFHGTNRACMLGESPSTVLLCCHKRCSLCSILRTSLAVSKCGKPFFFPCRLFTAKVASRDEECIQAVSEIFRHDHSARSDHSHLTDADTGMVSI